MEVPVYSLAERDRRWALARKLMAAEDVDALITYGGHESAAAAGFAPEACFSNDLPGSVVILSEEELAVVRYCAAAGEAAARAMAAVAAPGVTEAEVCAAGAAAAFRLGCPASMLMWSGRGFVAWRPPSWSYRQEPPRALEEGDILLAEVAPRFGTKETRHHAAIAIGGQHPDIETAAVIACASYQAGLRAARVGNTFGDLAEAMLVPLKQACSWNTQPLVRMLGAPGPARPPASGFGGELPLAPGMCCAFEPSAVVAGRAVSLGGTVLIGEDDPIELSPFTARMLRVPASRESAWRPAGGSPDDSTFPHTESR